ncbi:MAG TPA: hypothetical protein VM689_13410 [Aliidongia sp.]|nr:hypothetical protein [Aliidongia sp.]
MQQFEIFKAGTHTAVSGATIAFSTTDLADAVAAYDPALHEAPLVVGHPAMDAPAYGWVQSLKLAGDRLVAVPQQVDTAFGELVQAGRFKQRSASFYPPDHPANPKPGHWYLKHVGFLGAAAPAVKGLKPVAFGEIEGTLDFADWQGLAVAGLFGKLRDFFIAQFGQDKADAVLPSDAIDSLKFDAAQPDCDPAPADPTPSYAENPRMTVTNPAGAVPTEAELRARADKLAADEKKHAANEAAFAELQRTVRSAQIVTLVDGLVAGRKLPSGEKAGLIAFMEALPAGDHVIEFAEAGGKTAKLAPLDYLSGLFARLPNLVHFGEVAPALDPVNFAEDANSITTLSQRYIAEQKAIGRTVSPAEAVSHVTRARR